VNRELIYVVQISFLATNSAVAFSATSS